MRKSTRDVDLSKLEPWDMEKCRFTPQSDFYCFSHNHKKHSTGTRTNRATAAGFWKATRRDRVIYSSSERIGLMKILCSTGEEHFSGRGRTDWIMQEYRLDDHLDCSTQSNVGMGSEGTEEEVCRVFKKKSPHHKREETPAEVPMPALAKTAAGTDGALDQVLQPPFLEAASSSRAPAPTGPTDCTDLMAANSVSPDQAGFTDWGTLDRLVASHLNDQEDTFKQLACFNGQPSFVCQTPELDVHFPPLLQQDTRLFDTTLNDPGNDMDLWSFTWS